MADVRESFPSLEDTTTLAGRVLGARVEGDPSAAITGSIGFAFKDVTGDVVLPQLNASGQLPVTTEEPGNSKSARGTNAGSVTPVTVASITLAASKTYDSLDFIVSSFRDTIFEIVQSDDGVETILADALVGAGFYTANGALKELEFTSGATGVQLLIVRGTILNVAATMRAAISVRESV